MDRTQTIEEYLAGSLSDTEKAAFEQELLQDPDLRKELDAYKQRLLEDDELAEDLRLHKAINEVLEENKDLLAFREQLDDYMKKQEDKSNMQSRADDNTASGADRGIKKTGKKWLIAAAIILLIGLTGMIALLLSGSANPQKLYEAYYQPYDGDFCKRLADNTDNKSLLVALRAYENEEYSKALSVFDTLSTNQGEQVIVCFFQGLSLMEQNRPEEAIKKFEEVEEHGNNQFVYDAKWYKALSLLVIDKTGQSEKILRELSVQSSYYNKKARALLKDL